jgi:AraC-like DNA-binding protein
VIGSGDTLVSPPGLYPHIEGLLTVSSETLKVFVCPRRFASEMSIRAPGRPSPLDAWLVRDDGLGEALERLCDAIEEDRDAPSLQAAFSQLVDDLHQSLREPLARRLARKDPRSEIDRTRRILEDRFAEPVTLDELTDEVGLSKFHLLRLFRDEVGTTPHAYHLHVRISRARQMLDEGISAAEVALACGFADQAHFTRCFKHIVGFTPAAFARLA